MSSPQICRFFLAGNCKYGDSCNRSHDTGGQGGSRRAPSASQAPQARSNPRENGQRGGHQSQGARHGDDSRPTGRNNQQGNSYSQNGANRSPSGENMSYSDRTDGRDSQGSRPQGGRLNERRDGRNSAYQQDSSNSRQLRPQSQSNRYDRSDQYDERSDHTQGRSQDGYQRQGRGRNSSDSSDASFRSQPNPRTYDRHSQRQEYDNSSQRSYGGNEDDQQAGYRGNQNRGRDQGSSSYDQPSRTSYQRYNSSSSYQGGSQDPDQPQNGGRNRFQRSAYGRDSQSNGGYPDSYEGSDSSQGRYGESQRQEYPSRAQGEAPPYNRRQRYQQDDQRGNSSESAEKAQYVVYNGVHNDGRAWFTRGDGSLLQTHIGRQGVRHIGFGQQMYEYRAPVDSEYRMQIDDEYLDDPGAESSTNSDRPSSSAPQSADGSSHNPPPLYAPYYSKTASIPEEQLGMFTGKDFTTELPEDPPPFEHCYAPGDTPKQFAPKPVN